MSLIDELIQQGWLKTERIIKAFREIKREDFLAKGMNGLAESNTALPIGYGQTISQPLVVAFMLELLQPQLGEKILDVGSGSGWTSALLAHIVREKGKVIAIEIVPELMEFGKKNVSRYNYIRKGIVEFICADGSQGYTEQAPFDKILVSASVCPVRNEISNGAGKIPDAWKEQLKIGGKIVSPIGTAIYIFQKQAENKFIETKYPGFVFVPLIDKIK